MEKPQLSTLSRMADFEVLGYMIAEAMQEGNGDNFRQAIKVNVSKQNEEAVKANDTARILLLVLTDEIKGEGYSNRVELFPSQIYEKCKPFASGKSFPANETVLVKEMKKLKSALETEGLTFQEGKRKTKGKPYIFWKGNDKVESSPEQEEIENVFGSFTLEE
jgi:hypothetical protein